MSLPSGAACSARSASMRATSRSSSEVPASAGIGLPTARQIDAADEGAADGAHPAGGHAFIVALAPRGEHTGPQDSRRPLEVLAAVRPGGRGMPCALPGSLSQTHAVDQLLWVQVAAERPRDDEPVGAVAGSYGGLFRPG